MCRRCACPVWLGLNRDSLRLKTVFLLIRQLNIEMFMQHTSPSDL